MIALFTVTAVTTLTLSIQFFCQPNTPQLLFILGGKEVRGLLIMHMID
jgi:hypothetical protein